MLRCDSQPTHSEEQGQGDGCGELRVIDDVLGVGFSRAGICNTSVLGADGMWLPEIDKPRRDPGRTSPSPLSHVNTGELPMIEAQPGRQRLAPTARGK